MRLTEILRHFDRRNKLKQAARFRGKTDMLTRKDITEIVQLIRPTIFRKWKRAKRETAGWIIYDHVLWLDRSHCEECAVWIDDGVAHLMSAIGAVSFHTHPIQDYSGMRSISAADRISACAFGHEVVFTAKGIYLLIPYKKRTYKQARKLEDHIQAAVDEVKEGEAGRRLFEKLARREFKCHCYKIGDGL